MSAGRKFTLTPTNSDMLQKHIRVLSGSEYNYVVINLYTRILVSAIHQIVYKTQCNLLSPMTEVEHQHLTIIAE